MVRSNDNYEHDKVFNNKLKRLKRRKRKEYEEIEYGAFKSKKKENSKWVYLKQIKIKLT